MSHIKRVVLIFGSLVVLSIIINIAIIASNGGFNNPSKPIEIPNKLDLWSAGMNITDGDEMSYNLTIKNENNNYNNYLVKILFKNKENFWNTEFFISNETESKIFYGNLSKSNLIFQKKNMEYKKYIDLIESSLLQIKDITREPRYLVIGAKWDSISTGITDIPVKIVSRENLKTEIGNLETFVLSYKLGKNNSNIWISKDLPLPVKAMVFNVDDTLEYKFDLISTNKVT